MKKKLPLDILKGFQPKENENIYLIKAEAGKDFIMNFIDKDPESDFYFRIIKFNDSNKKFLIEYKPASAGSTSNISAWHTIDGVNKLFKHWTAIINEYNVVETIFDDPIIKGFTDDYFNEIKLLDPEAEHKPFSYKQILILDEHLEKIEKGVEKFKDLVNQDVINEIKNDTHSLRSELTQKPKNQILRKLALIWAKLSKQGLPLIKEFISEGVKEVIRIGIKTMIES